MSQWSEPLTRQDAGYLARETDAQPMHFVLACTLAEDPTGRVTLDAVREQVAARVHRIPALRTRLQLPPFGIGPLHWVDAAEFDVADHVLPWPDEPPGGEVVDAVRAMAQRHLDRDRPLWEIRVRPATATDAPVVTFSTHHALMDGGLVRSVVDALFDPDPVGDVPPWLPRRPVSRWRPFVLGIGRAVRNRLRRAVTSTPGQPAPSFGGVLAGEVGTGRVLQTMTIPLDEIRVAARAHGVTVNDVFVAVVTGGLRRLLDHRGSLEATDDLLALVPRNVRTQAEVSASGNRTWSMFITLPIHEPGPQGRLMAIHAATSEAKTAQAPAGNAAFRFDVTISNVRLGGPHLVAGVPINSLHAAVPLQGNNRLAVVGLSTDKTFGITVTGDEAAFPDIDVFVTGMGRELDSLQPDE